MKTLYKNCRISLVIITNCLLGSLLVQSAWAQNSKFPIKLEASVGTQYDSNITVEEIDTSSTRNDMALLLDFDADFRQPLTKDITVNAGYSFSQSLYDELDQFDIQTHLFSTGLGYDIGQKTSTGLNYNYADSSLDGDRFLTLARLSPFVSHYVSKKFFVRTAYIYTDKSFDGRPTRDAESQALGIDMYYFLNGPRSYLIAGYKYKDEEANSARFDYDGYQLKARWIQRLDLLGKKTKLKLGWRFEQRDYEDISSAGGQKRDDTRQRWSVDFEIPLQKKSYLLLEYEYSDYESNVDTVDYIQHLVRIGVGRKFF